MTEALTVIAKQLSEIRHVLYLIFLVLAGMLLFKNMHGK